MGRGRGGASADSTGMEVLTRSGDGVQGGHCFYILSCAMKEMHVFK